MARDGRRPANYDRNVFVNCPFDDLYKPLFDAIIFAVYDMGFRPRCAKDLSNAGQPRFNKIQDLIQNCKYSIHDISRTELDPVSALPRFNLPLELQRSLVRRGPIVERRQTRLARSSTLLEHQTRQGSMGYFIQPLCGLAARG